jgi:hypothetical protein
MPARMEETSGGVRSVPFETAKRFSPLPSETRPWESRAMPSAKPPFYASTLMSCEFM